MLKAFILEDDIARIIKFKEWFWGRLDMTITDDVDEAKKHLMTNKYDIIFLDHDLGGQQMVSTMEYNTGSTLVKFIVSNKLHMDSTYVLHTLNPIGRQNMYDTLKCCGYRDVHKRPFGTFDQSLINFE